MAVTVLTRPTNGVSYGLRHAVTAAEIADGTIIFDFQNSVDLVANVLLFDTDGTQNYPITNMIVTYPSVGQVSLEFEWEENDVIFLIANRARTD